MNVILNTISSDKPIALSWIYKQQKNQILDAVYHLSHSKNITDFRTNIELIHAPGLNIMYGDAQNNISWTAAGKLYKLPKNINPNFILNGTNGEDDKKEFLDFSKNPTALNQLFYKVDINYQTEKIIDCRGFKQQYPTFLLEGWVFFIYNNMLIIHCQIKV
jgi:penicillin amidase